MKNTQKLRERLADLEHTQWSSWIKYMLENLSEDNIRKWKRQLSLPYSKLSEEEKESDRKWADKVLKILAEECRKIS